MHEYKIVPLICQPAVSVQQIPYFCSYVSHAFSFCVHLAASFFSCHRAGNLRMYQNDVADIALSHVVLLDKYLHFYLEFNIQFFHIRMRAQKLSSYQITKAVPYL